MRDVQSSPEHRESIEMEAGELPQRRTSRRLSTFLPHLPHSYRDERPKQYKQVSNRPRWVLHMQAVFWRVLMNLGMWFHRMAPPRPPKPNFYRTINSTVSGKPGSFTLYFYVPSDYYTQKRLWTHRHEPYASDDEADRAAANERNRNNRVSISSIGDIVRRRSRSARRWGGYPVIINFHGGGFTLGSAYDDARWCGTVVNECNAIVVSVDYRLAPEHSFPTAVEDGVDAVLWIHKHAEELGINTDKIILSGFSSGGNMAFTVPLRLYDQQTGFHRDTPNSKAHLADVSEQDEAASRTASVDDRPASSAWDTASSSSTKLVSGTGEVVDGSKPPPPPPANRHPPKQSTNVSEQGLGVLPDVRIRGIVPWYPSLDYTRTRAERRATCVRTDQELPALFTNLFDDSYLHPPKDVTLDSPYLSPGVAPTDLLRNALPDEIVMYTCEWDMLLEEGQEFYQRLISDEIDKNVVYTMVPEVPHGWDKAPNPWRPTPGVREHYLKACKEIRRILGQRESTMDRLRDPRPSMVN